MRLTASSTDLLFTLIATDMKVRYGGALLGFLWAFLKPFCLFLILVTVFSRLGSSVTQYPMWLLLGIILFHFFSEGTRAGMHALQARAALLLRINVPLSLFVTSATLNAFLHLLFSLTIFALFLAWNGSFPPLSTILPFSFLLFTLLLLTLGCSFLLSLLLIMFKDFTHIWELLTALLFYLTPIFYPLSLAPPAAQWILLLNPLTVIIDGSRSVLLLQGGLSLPSSLALLAFTGSCALIGGVIFRRAARSVLVLL
jgi:ABC-2 type transport system permease protein